MMLHFSKLQVLFLFCSCLQRSTSLSPPHIIFLLIDDLGWNDVSFHGSLQIPTPNIDALAYTGTILNNYYVQPICTPSRGALMTGKYPIKLGLQHYVISSAEPWGLSPGEKLLQQYLKELGYETHGVGKWHLGYFQEDYLPTNRGFDSFFGYWTGKKDYFTHFEEDDGLCGLDLHDGVESDWSCMGYYATELFTDRAKKIIESHNSSKPLFLYISHQAVHAGNSYSPLQAPLRNAEKFGHIHDEPRRQFAGIVSALDDSVGEIFSALDKRDMLKNSLIVFSTDNGGAVEGMDESSGSNWPLRGSKFNMWEGGVRGTAFIWSPLLGNSHGHVVENLMHITDWLPTLYTAAGGDPNELEKIDGYNQWPTIIGKEPSPRTEILHNIDDEWKVEAIRKGRYKLLKGSVFNGTFDMWFDKEGKRKENIPFDNDNLRDQHQIYKKSLKDSKVFQVLSQNYESLLRCPRISKDGKDTCGLDGEIENCSAEQNEESKEENLISNIVRSRILINCRTKPENASTNCQPMKEYCLFDVEKDPCEYNNLASDLKPIVKELSELLDKYRHEAVPIRNQPADPNANPKYHGYSWIPWKGRHPKRKML